MPHSWHVSGSDLDAPESWKQLAEIAGRADVPETCGSRPSWLGVSPVRVSIAATPAHTDIPLLY
jgi:hypothetical protein